MSLMHPDNIRTQFSQAMSDLYRTEVPQYGALCDLVRQVNAAVIEADPERASRLRREGQIDRLEVERHGAIRLGKPQELATIRRMFELMGMQPVGYYDLSTAGIPVHATAFRPTTDDSLARNPFRVFTSLLRLDLLTDPELRRRAAEILAHRNIFTARCLSLLEQAEREGGLTPQSASEFIEELLHTFRWHREATVDLRTYRELRAAHPLVADIVSFRGPHINHLTPRTLDIDQIQEQMRVVGLAAKDSIEGPPLRKVPILLRQTSFLALEEPIRFAGEANEGTHSARFGEVEQRGCALTRKGRTLYDQLLAETRAKASASRAREDIFSRFPDDADALFREQLAFFRFHVDEVRLESGPPPEAANTQALVTGGWLVPEPITYEDFLPVSAAGIFQSNLGNEVRSSYSIEGNQSDFEAALGVPVIDEILLYEAAQAASLAACKRALLPSQVAPGRDTSM